MLELMGCWSVFRDLNEIIRGRQQDRVHREGTVTFRAYASVDVVM